MFCNKCGKELPDGTKFCSGCGAQLKAPAAAPTAPAATSTPRVGVTASVPGSVGGASFAGSRDYKRLAVIGAAVLTVAALIFMFLPWFNYNFTSAYTGSSSVLEVSSLKDLLTTAAKINSGSANETAMAFVQEIDKWVSALTVLWGAGLVLGIAGLVSVVIGKPRNGFFMLLGPALSSVGWLIAVGSVDSKLQMIKDWAIKAAEGNWFVDTSSVKSLYEGFGISAGTWLIVCLVCSIVAFLLYMASNREPLIKK